MNAKKNFRPGNIGALMDEYERAMVELVRLVERIPEDVFERVMDAETEDEACRSVQTITAHVVGAGFGYANYLRDFFGIPADRPERQLFPKPEALRRLHAVLEYTAETLDGRWAISYDEIVASSIQSRWGPTYNVEQLLEHAIVHVLRHRRQIEKFVASAQSEI